MNQDPQILHQAPTPTTGQAAIEAPLIARLKKLKIDFEIHRHTPVFTVEESAHLYETIPGAHTKNLFLRDKKKRRALVTASGKRQIDLKQLSTTLDMGRLSFGSADSLQDMLGVTPGSVTPFALINATNLDPATGFQFGIDSTLAEVDIINVHPLHNAATVSITPEGLFTFVHSCGFAPKVIDLSA